MNFKHDGRPRHVFYEKYYYIEVRTVWLVVVWSSSGFVSQTSKTICLQSGVWLLSLSCPQSVVIKREERITWDLRNEIYLKWDSEVRSELHPEDPLLSPILLGLWGCN
jgi:hypothetical protein